MTTKIELDRRWRETGLAEFIGFGDEPELENCFLSHLADDLESFCPDCGQPFDAFGYCPAISTKDAARGIQTCGKNRSQVLDHPNNCSCNRCCNTRRLLN